MPTTIDARDWKVLLESLKQRKCAVLVGPGVPVSGLDGAPRNLATNLSRTLAKELKTKYRLKVEDPANLPLVAELFLDRCTRADLEIEVCDFYKQALHDLKHNRVPDPTFESLASLPFRLYVSSRHDLVLEHYLKPRGPVSKCYTLRGDAQLTLGEVGRVERPLVYHLLGSISEPASLVLTESDLLDLIRSIASDDPPLPKDLANEFGSNSFLFIGCGLHTYYSRVLLHLLKLSRSQQRSFALESIPVNDDTDTFQVEYRRGVWFYEVGYKTLKVIDSDEQKFITELRRRWEAEPEDGKGPAPPVPPPAVRPVVFLSYVKEDVDDALRLMAALDRHGVDTWLDTFRLIGGDQWPNSIADAILKDVHFFIVLLSEHLDDGVETYVHTEITTALERRSRRGALKFIYPISVADNYHRLDALDRAQLQVQYLKDLNADIARLVEDIQKQFARYRRR